MWSSNDCDGQYSTYWFCGFQGTDKDCAVHQEIFDKWHLRAVAWREAYGAYAAKAWHVFSGLRGNLVDPVAWQLAGVLIEENLDLFVGGYVQLMWYSADGMPAKDNYDNPCWGPPQDATPQPTDVMRGSAGQPCAAGSLASRVALAVEGEVGAEGEGVAWSIKQSCSSTDYEADVSPVPFLAGFAKASYNTDGSGITFFVGSKASGSVAGSSASFESSLYVTLNGQGRITDFGWDVGPEAEAGAGPVKIQAYSDHVRLSFMSVFSDTPATF
jgi:hypothetical protein